MSADNRICIMYCGPDGWAVWHGNGSTDYWQPPCHAKWFGSIQEADVWAMEDGKRVGYLEYGVQHISKEEQETGLLAEIEDLKERLSRLRRYNRQWREDGDEPVGYAPGGEARGGCGSRDDAPEVTQPKDASSDMSWVSDPSIPTEVWLEKLASSMRFRTGRDTALENAHLRAALQDIATKAHCIALSGPATTKTLEDAWGKFIEINCMAAQALAKARRSAETP
jgi:hypothetical protein